MLFQVQDTGNTPPQQWPLPERGTETPVASLKASPFLFTGFIGSRDFE